MAVFSQKTILLLLISGCLLFSGCISQRTLQVSEAWARPGLEGGNSAAFFLIDNPTSEGDTLLSASGNIAQAIEIHKSSMDAEVMKMEKLDSVEIPAKEAVTFAPGVLHLMLIGLNQPLNIDDTFTLTLSFEKAGEMYLDVTVKEP